MPNIEGPHVHTMALAFCARNTIKTCDVLIALSALELEQGWVEVRYVIGRQVSDFLTVLFDLMRAQCPEAIGTSTIKTYDLVIR